MNVNQFDHVTSLYRNKGILLDSNLLLLLLVGYTAPAYIHQFKRTDKFNEADFQLLRTFVELFPHHVTTPHVLTEVSNFATSLHSQYRIRFFTIYSRYITSAAECSVASAQVASTVHCHRFGLTDAAIVETAPRKYLLLTDDAALSDYFERLGGHAVNFDNLSLANS